MSVKASFRYMGQNLLVSTGWYYAILLGMKILLTILIAFAGVYSNGSGLELASAIFLLVMGLNMFTENFGMLLQNGISRKTFFVTRLLAFACTSVLVSAVDGIIRPLIELMPTGGGLFGSTTLFDFLYQLQGAGGVALNILLCALLNFFVLNLGAFIVTMFYRLPKWAKPLVGAGVPILLFMVLPIIDVNVVNGAISRGITQAFTFCFGINTTSPQPLAGAASLLVLAALFAALGWLLTRRATFRK